MVFQANYSQINNPDTNDTIMNSITNLIKLLNSKNFENVWLRIKRILFVKEQCRIPTNVALVTELFNGSESFNFLNFLKQIQSVFEIEMKGEIYFRINAKFLFQTQIYQFKMPTNNLISCRTNNQ